MDHEDLITALAFRILRATLTTRIIQLISRKASMRTVRVTGTTLSGVAVAGSNAAYTSASGPILSRVVTLLTALVQSLRAYIGRK